MLSSSEEEPHSYQLYMLPFRPYLFFFQIVVHVHDYLSCESKIESFYSGAK